MDDLQLTQSLLKLTRFQKEWISAVLEQFAKPRKFVRNKDSDLISQEVLNRLGDSILIHHAFSRQALSKDRFEFALEKSLNLSGIQAQLMSSRTFRGRDITIDGVPVSLKTEAAHNLREDMIHISKWMELGKGAWELPRLVALFLEHMQSYDRIFTLRCHKPSESSFFYELVEIPKKLLLEAKNCRLQISEDSKQVPKPGYGYVTDRGGQLKFALYFDGGTERKLQIKDIRKSLCVVHATWGFESSTS